MKTWLFNRTQQLLQEWEQEERRRGQYTTGKTSRSWKVEPTEKGVVVTGATHTETLERGRPPKKAPRGFYYIIMRWAEAKGLMNKFRTISDFKRFVWFTSQKIEREGTQLYRDGGNSGTIEEPLQRYREDLKRELAGAYTHQITETIYTNH